MRAWGEGVYGIPKENIIGSNLKGKYEYKDGKATILKLPELDLMMTKKENLLQFRNILEENQFLRPVIQMVIFKCWSLPHLINIKISNYMCIILTLFVNGLTTEKDILVF